MKSFHLLLSLLLLMFLSGYGTADENSTQNTSHADLLLTTDLAITGSATPQVVEMGSPLNAGISVMNAGPASAKNIRIDYYLLKYNTTDAQPIWLHQKTADDIPPFYHDMVPFSIDVPGGISPGLYSLFSTISTSTVDRNLTNNQFVSSAPIEVRRSLGSSQSGLPDLSMSLDSISSHEIAPGYPFTINYTVYNTGNGNAGTFHVGFYLSPDPAVEPSDLRLWDKIYYNAYPGMAEPGVSTDIVPMDIPPGEYYLGGIVDFTHMVTETDEERNSAILPTPITVKDLKPPVDEKFLDKVAGYIAVKTNIYRQYRGLPNLSFDQDLANIAKSHSIDMATRNYFAHETPEGIDPTSRAESAKYETSKRLQDGTIRTGIAENIVKISAGYIIGKGYSGFVDPSNPEAVADAMMIEWISSPEHNQNLVNSGIDKIGVGVAYNGEDFYATQNFY